MSQILLWSKVLRIFLDGINFQVTCRISQRSRVHQGKNTPVVETAFPPFLSPSRRQLAGAADEYPIKNDGSAIFDHGGIVEFQGNAVCLLSKEL